MKFSEVDRYTEQQVLEHIDNYHVRGKRFKSLEGEVFGDLTVIKLWGRSHDHTWWFVRCTCGIIFKTSTNRLNSKAITACKACSGKEKPPLLKNNIKDKDWVRSEVLKKYSYIDFVSQGDGGTKWVWFCNKCKVDFKMSPKGILLYPDRKPRCMCDGTGRFTDWTAALREVQINKRCLELGIYFVGWKEGYVDNKSRVVLSCSNSQHEEWDSSVNNFIGDTRYSCPDCGIDKRAASSKHNADKIATEGKILHEGKYTYENYIYTDSRSPSIIDCVKCCKPFEQSFDNHINKKKGCPSCAGYGYNSGIEGWFYIQNLSDIYCKYGVTNYAVLERLKQQSRHSIYSHEIIFEKLFQDGKVPLSLERLVRKKFNTSVVHRDNLPDGFTETFKIKDLPLVLVEVDKYIRQDTICKEGEINDK